MRGFFSPKVLCCNFVVHFWAKILHIFYILIITVSPVNMQIQLAFKNAWLESKHKIESFVNVNFSEKRSV